MNLAPLARQFFGKSLSFLEIEGGGNGRKFISPHALLSRLWNNKTGTVTITIVSSFSVTRPSWLWGGGASTLKGSDALRDWDKIYEACVATYPIWKENSKIRRTSPTTASTRAISAGLWIYSSSYGHFHTIPWKYWALSFRRGTVPLRHWGKISPSWLLSKHVPWNQPTALKKRRRKAVFCNCWYALFLCCLNKREEDGGW